VSDRLAIVLPKYVLASIAAVPIILVVTFLLFGLEVYLNVLSVLALAVALASIGATLFMVGLVLEENAAAVADSRPLGWRRLTLTRVLTLATVIVQAFALYIGVLAAVRLAGGDPIEWTPPITATVFVALESVPLMFAGYLSLLRRLKRLRGDGTASPPPFDAED